jgi:hypothetical protein
VSRSAQAGRWRRYAALSVRRSTWALQGALRAVLCGFEGLLGSLEELMVAAEGTKLLSGPASYRLVMQKNPAKHRPYRP